MAGYLGHVILLKIVEMAALGHVLTILSHWPQIIKADDPKLAFTANLESPSMFG